MALSSKVVSAACRLQIVISKPQLELALRLHESGLTFVADYYPPAKKLVAAGYAEWVGTKLKLTPAGRAMVDQVLKEAQ